MFGRHADKEAFNRPSTEHPQSTNTTSADLPYGICVAAAMLPSRKCLTPVGCMLQRCDVQPLLLQELLGPSLITGYVDFAPHLHNHVPQPRA
jgi:hypothetical protein